MDTEVRSHAKAVAGDLHLLKSYVPLDMKLTVEQRAAKAGLSVSAYLKSLIERDEVDDGGRPVWAPGPAQLRLDVSLSARPAA
jgi:hypothetical protein